MSTIAVNNITDEQGSGRPAFTNGVQTSNINGGQVGGRRNLIINGGFDVWQRGTSFTLTNSDYTVDRLKCAVTGGGEVSITRQENASPTNAKYHLRLEKTQTGEINPQYLFEPIKFLQGTKVTLSYWVKASVAFTPNYIYVGNSSSQTYISPDQPLPEFDNSWQKYELTFTIDNDLDFDLLYLMRIPNDWLGTLEISQVQLEVGDTATEFEHRSYGEELALCQRYYQNIGKYNASSFPLGSGYFFDSGTGSGAFYIPLSCPMRISHPSVSTSTEFIEIRGGNTGTNEDFEVDDGFQVEGGGDIGVLSLRTFTTSSVPITEGNSVVLANNKSSIFLQVDAEL